MTAHTPEATLRSAKPGDTYSRAVQGGVRRAEVPGAGVVVELPDADVFVPADALAVLLAALGYAVVAPRSGP